MQKPKKIPERMCTACREKKHKAALIRIVRDEDGSLIVDKTGKKNGRGAYICNNVDCLRRAQKTRALQRALEVTVPSEWYDEVAQSLEESPQSDNGE